LIRINPRLYFQCLGKEYIFWGPTIYSLRVGRGESAVALRYDENTYIQLDLQQKTKPVYTGYTDYPSKHYWWYKDQILVCDEKFDAKVIKGWHVKQRPSKREGFKSIKNLLNHPLEQPANESRFKKAITELQLMQFML